MLGCFRGVAYGICVLIFVSACASDGASAADGQLRPQIGPFEGTLTIEPNPPHVGEHRVVITLDQLDSAPLEGATVELSPWMPAHGHGSTDVEAVEEAPGVYVAQDVWLNMPGIWDLRVRVEAEALGELTATFEIP